MSSNGVQVPLSELEISTLLSKRQTPKLTFGLEMELDFSIDRQLYFDWLDTNPWIDPLPKIDDYYNRPTRRTDHWVTARNLYNTRVVLGLQKPSPTFSETSRNSHSTSSQESDNLRQNLLHYFIAFLNRELPTSKPGKLLIGDVPWGRRPKTASANIWTLVYDDSLNQSRAGYGKTFDPPQPYKTMRKFFRCVGAELVSKVYEYDKLDTVVFPALKELHEELENNYQHGAWFTEEEHLHVHFALGDEEIGLQLAQTLCVLYGLFENQIERFVKNSQRESRWCTRLRQGMNTRRMWLRDHPDSGDLEIGLCPEGRYTPGGFADAIYATETLQELKTQICGYSAGEEVDGTVIPRLRELGVRNWVALNISMARNNKPTTFEFRHHHGSTDPVEIKYWVEFCGHMLTFAHLLVKSGIKLQDPKQITPYGFGCSFPMLEYYVRNDILDIIGMSNEARTHFRNQQARFYNSANQALRIMEEYLVIKRIERNIFMDEKIRADPEFARMLRSYLDRAYVPRKLGVHDRGRVGLLNVGAAVKDIVYGKKLHKPKGYAEIEKYAE